MEVGLEVNAEKANYILMPRRRNGKQNHNTKKGNRSSENVSTLKYFLTTVEPCFGQGRVT
jgi:hypothetical protein